MSVPDLTAVRLTRPAPDKPLLVLGPSLGTAVSPLWSATAALLADTFEVVGWEVPGHGHGGPATESFTMADLAAGVLAMVAGLGEAREDATFGYAGDSIGGAVGLQLALDAGPRLTGLVVVCSGARIGDEEMWATRADGVRASGTASVVESSAARWFAPGFLDRHPERGAALLHALRDADDESYAKACEALATFDVRDRLGEIDVPVLVVAGAHDVATPPALAEQIAAGVVHGSAVVLDEVAHLAPVESPEDVAALILEHYRPSTPSPSSWTGAERYDAGMAVRREVLGDEHVDRAVARTTGLTADYQDLITRYAWGEIWTRPGLDRRSRSIVTLTALVAGGHHEELAMHLRAARRNGLSVDEIGEVLLQTAIYCGVPDANTAFRIAQEVLEE